jgi:hypothetical protein
MSRLLGKPVTIRVEVSADGAPTRVFWRGRWHEVVVASRWRLEDGWWRPGAEVSREYFRLRTRLFVSSSGRASTSAARFLMCVVYRDEVTGLWYLERLLD